MAFKKFVKRGALSIIGIWQHVFCDDPAPDGAMRAAVPGIAEYGRVVPPARRHPAGSYPAVRAHQHVQLGKHPALHDALLCVLPVLVPGLSRNSVCLTQPAHFSEFLPLLHA